MNLSDVIMELEQVDREFTAGLIRREEAAARMENAAENLFRIAGRVKHGR